MAQCYLGEIRPTPYTFAPEGWAFCAGQLLNISDYSALYSLIGTTFGGDGINTFGLPDLQSRIPIGFQQGPGLSPYALGQIGGIENVSLTASQLPSHSHPVATAESPATSSSAVGALPALAEKTKVYAPSPTGTLAAATVGSTGSGGPHPNIQPFGVVTYIIALQGTYPSFG